MEKNLTCRSVFSPQVIEPPKIENENSSSFSKSNKLHFELKQFIIDAPIEPESKKVENKINTKKPAINLKQKKSLAITGDNNLDKYIRYLKQILKEKSFHSKIEIPPLCQCNLISNCNKSSILDYDWNKCANNCLFYKNPKGISNSMI